MDPGPSLSLNGFPVHLLLPHYTYISTLGGRRALLYIYLFCFSGPKRADFISAAASQWMAPPPPKKKDGQTLLQGPNNKEEEVEEEAGVGGGWLSVAASLAEGAHVLVQHLWLVSHSADASRRPPLFVRLLHYLPPPRPFFFFCRFFFLSPSFPHPPGPSTAIYHRGETLCPPQLEKLMNK